MTTDRYHLLLAIDGRPVMHGWWADRSTADRKFRGWIGEYGSRPGARITLVDTEDDRQLEAWLQPAPTVSGGS